MYGKKYKTIKMKIVFSSSNPSTDSLWVGVLIWQKIEENSSFSVFDGVIFIKKKIVVLTNFLGLRVYSKTLRSIFYINEKLCYNVYLQTVCFLTCDSGYIIKVRKGSRKKKLFLNDSAIKRGRGGKALSTKFFFFTKFRRPFSWNYCYCYCVIRITGLGLISKDWRV